MFAIFARLQVYLIHIGTKEDHKDFEKPCTKF